MNIDAKNFITLTIDGYNHRVEISQISVHSDGKVTIQCVPTEEQAQSAITEEKPRNNNKPRIRSYLHASSLCRFLYDGRLMTGAITHCTDLAVRVLNLELGVAWIPKNVLRWSEMAGQFCVTDEDYEMDFTTQVTKGMEEYPVLYDPDVILNNEFE